MPAATRAIKPTTARPPMAACRVGELVWYIFIGISYVPQGAFSVKFLRYAADLTELTQWCIDIRDDMSGIIEFTVRLIRAVKRAYARKWDFLGLFVFVFVASVFVLGELDLLPSTKSDLVLGLPGTKTAEAQSPIATPIMIIELPTKIVIEKINLTVTVQNPTTTSIPVLDEELLKGAVRYPTSAKLGEAGNVVLFGHSSYLPIVGNQAYKTFNGIQKLSVGDVVTVSSAAAAYTYRVRSVAKESANDNSAIPLSVAGKMLTLVTCNSFGAKEDRFVVVADFVESHVISG